MKIFKLETQFAEYYSDQPVKMEDILNYNAPVLDPDMFSGQTEIIKQSNMFGEGFSFVRHPWIEKQSIYRSNTIYSQADLINMNGVGAVKLFERTCLVKVDEWSRLYFDHQLAGRIYIKEIKTIYQKGAGNIPKLVLNISGIKE